ncbi:hypothetical protein FVER14953_20558 [Fusarium verticillioides]|nr:hypothetical protein FVER14953_20558 [Fusarium verticillioides]
MSQEQFQDTLNKACEAAVKKALSGLDTHINEVVNSRSEELGISVATYVSSHLEKVLNNALLDH